jgi:hypothetical protein
MTKEYNSGYQDAMSKYQQDNPYQHGTDAWQDYTDGYQDGFVAMQMSLTREEYQSLELKDKNDNQLSLWEAE